MRSIATRSIRIALVTVGFWSPGLAAPAGTSADRAELPEVRGVDGEKLDLRAPEGGVSTIVFYSTECPISNAYSPTLKALAERFPADRAGFVGLCVDPDITDEAVRAHKREYALPFPVARDKRGTLARQLGVSVTPEVVVIDDQARIRYLGRIDDQYVERQKRNANPGAHDLGDAIAALLDSRDVPRVRVDAVGCPLPEPLPARAVTYSNEVAPILRRHCIDCHSKGQVGPFALETYEQARKRADDLASVIEDRRMPPWKPSPGVGPGLKHDKSLTANEIRAVVAWAEAGAPEGNALREPLSPAASGEWKLGTPDLVLELPAGFEIPADGDDVYRCFVIPSGLTRDTPISAIEYLPGNRRVVHHILSYSDTMGQARKRDEAEEGVGYSCFSGPGIEIHGDLGGWAPGNEPSFLPEGVGRILPKGADVVVQVHYHPTGKPETDRTRIGLYFARAPLKQTLHWTAAANLRMVLPPGEKHVEIRAQTEMPVNVTAFGVTPHMHLLGKVMEMTVEFPDGKTQPLIRIDDWDFNWQNTYYFQKPINLPRGTRLKVRAVFDNSADNPRNPKRPPVEVKWGEATTDEMCIGFLAVTRTGQDLTQPGEKDDLRQIFDNQRSEAEARYRSELEKRRRATTEKNPG